MGVSPEGNLSGATKLGQLTLRNAQAGNTGAYSVVISNSSGAIHQSPPQRPSSLATAPDFLWARSGKRNGGCARFMAATSGARGDVAADNLGNVFVGPVRFNGGLAPRSPRFGGCPQSTNVAGTILLNPLFVCHYDRFGNIGLGPAGWLPIPTATGAASGGKMEPANAYFGPAVSVGSRHFRDGNTLVSSGPGEAFSREV